MNVLKISNFIITIVQLFTIVAVTLLEYLSKKKMGVMRYVMYKNNELQTTLFNTQLLLFYKIILIVIATLLLILIIFAFNKDKYFRCKNTSIVTIVLTFTSILFCFFSNTLNLRSQYFFFIGIFIIVLVQYLKLTITIIYSMKNK